MQVDIIFQGTTGGGRREDSISASRLFLWKPRSSMCVQKKVHGQFGQPPPKSVGCFSHWNEVKDVLKCFLRCNLNVERGDQPEV